MNVSVERAIFDLVRSIGGLLGGEAQKLSQLDEKKSVCGSTIHKAIINALAVAETNASMGVIVAAPTVGSAGILPAVLMSLFEYHDINVDTLRAGMINASAIGYIITRNGSISGAEAGCQAEIGSASAMAASALVEMLGILLSSAVMRLLLHCPICWGRTKLNRSLSSRQGAVHVKGQPFLSL